MGGLAGGATPGKHCLYLLMAHSSESPLKDTCFVTMCRCSIALRGLHHCSHSKTRIEATSLLWCRPILKPSEDDWDSGSVGAPCGVSMADGKWRL